MTHRRLLFVSSLLAASLTASSADIRINEVHANPPGSDVAGSTGAEFIELISTGGEAESTDGLWLVLLDADGGNMGRVDGAWDLAGLSTGSNGLLLLGLDFVASNGGPWRARIQNGTALGDIASATSPSPPQHLQFDLKE